MHNNVNSRICLNLQIVQMANNRTIIELVVMFSNGTEPFIIVLKISNSVALHRR